MSKQSRGFWGLLLVGLMGLSLGSFGQTCQPSNSVTTNCSPTGATCGEPTEANAEGDTSAWPQGTTVAVNINTTGLSTAMVQAITEAFANWNGVGNVTFVVGNSTSNASGVNVYNVWYGSDPSNPTANAFSTPSSTTDGKYTNGNDTELLSNNLTTCLTCFMKVMAHEIGHTFGLNDNSIAGSAMQDGCSQGATFPTNCQSVGPTIADMLAADCEASYSQNTCFNPAETAAAACGGNGGSGGSGGGSGPSGSCTGSPSCTGATCENGTWVCPIVACQSGECTSSGCVPECTGNETWNPTSCICEIATSPIIIDLDGLGFHLTSPSNGVLFDFFGDGKPGWLAWTAADSTNGWLALDRNGNGLIDSGKELFGNITDQPASDDPNGFRALAVFDQPSEGGNGDGVIDAKDKVWPALRVWVDKNHDGVSQREELFTLDTLGISGIRLGYTLSRRTDEYGNTFRYKGSLRRKANDGVNRVIYDVFLVPGAGTP